MALSSSLNLRLGIDVSNLDKELKKVERTLSRFGSNMKNIGSNLTTSLTMPILGLGAAALKSFADFEKLENGLTAIMGSSEDAAKELIKLRKVAENPGLALPQVVQASSSLQSVGMSADAARETITQFGNAVARSGGGAEQFSGVVLALSQISAVGKVTQEDLNQIKERLPEFSRVMKEEFGVVTAEAIRGLGISSEEFITRSVGALGKLERANGGLANTFDNLKDNVTASLGELGKAINENLKLEEVASKISESIQNLVDKFKALSPEQQGMIVKIGLIAASIGPLLLIIGQFASSISSIISLSRVLIGLFGTLSSATGIGAVVIAVTALAIAYGNTSDGQKSIKATGESMLKTFGNVKETFTEIFKLLEKLGPSFNFLLKVVFDSIRQIFNFFNWLYEVADLADKAIEKLLNINQPQKGAQNANKNLKQGEFGSGFISENNSFVQNTPKGSFDTKKIIEEQIKKQKAIADELAKAKAEAEAAAALKAASKLNTIKKLDKKLFDFDEFKTLNDLQKATDELNKSVITNVEPKIRESLGLKEGKLSLLSMKNAANDVLALGEKLKSNPPNMAKPFSDADAAIIKLEEKMASLIVMNDELSKSLTNLINNALTDLASGFGEQLGNALSGAKFQIKALLVPLADAIISFGKMAIQAGITALAIKKALTLAQAPLAIAAGIALVAIGTAIKNGIATPKLAQGGLAYGPTLATVGDNKNARVDPEVIAPLSKLKSMMGDMGVGGTLETRISGNDLIILLNRSQKGLNRIQ